MKGFFVHLKLANLTANHVRSVQVTLVAGTCFYVIWQIAISGNGCVKAYKPVRFISVHNVLTNQKTKVDSLDTMVWSIRWCRNG